jgi:hypothetical protein
VDVLNNDDTPVIFSNTLAVDKVALPDGEDAPATALVQSSADAYLVGPDGKETPRSKAVYTLAALSNVAELNGDGSAAKVTSSRVAALGTAEVASNRYQDAFGNQELMVRLIQDVAGADPLVAAYREVGASAQFAVTGDQRTSLIRRTVVAPCIAAIIFVPFALYRLRRG